jgi:hypothetical protein
VRADCRRPSGGPLIIGGPLPADRGQKRPEPARCSHPTLRHRTLAPGRALTPAPQPRRCGPASVHRNHRRRHRSPRRDQTHHTDPNTGPERVVPIGIGRWCWRHRRVPLGRPPACPRKGRTVATPGHHRRTTLRHTRRHPVRRPAQQRRPDHRNSNDQPRRPRLNHSSLTRNASLVAGPGSACRACQRCPGAGRSSQPSAGSQRSRPELSGPWMAGPSDRRWRCGRRWRRLRVMPVTVRIRVAGPSAADLLSAVEGPAWRDQDVEECWETVALPLHDGDDPEKR